MTINSILGTSRIVLEENVRLSNDTLYKNSFAKEIKHDGNVYVENSDP